MRRLACLQFLLLLFVVACSARSNGFGEPPDAGDVDPDAPDMTTEEVGVDMPDAETKKEVGEECMGPRDCVDDALCIGTTDGEFVCMQKCAETYSICEGGSVCLPVMTQNAAICYTGGHAEAKSTCASNLDCDSGLLCFGANQEFYCRQACGDADECADEDYCLELSTGAGLCRSRIGAPCLQEACPGDLTCTTQDPELDPLFPSGYCSMLDCNDDGDCGGEAVCREVPGTTDRTLCYTRCEHRSDCRFNGSYDCLDNTSCDDATDPEACEALFGEDSLCAPTGG